MFAGIIEWSMINGCSEFGTATDLRFERILKRAGWPMQRLGEPIRIGNITAIAGALPIDAVSFRNGCRLAEVVRAGGGGCTRSFTSRASAPPGIRPNTMEKDGDSHVAQPSPCSRRRRPYGPRHDLAHRAGLRLVRRQPSSGRPA